MGARGLTRLAVLPEHQVGVVQRRRAAHVRPLLAIVGHIEGNAALGGARGGRGGTNRAVRPPSSPPPAPQLAPYLPLGLVEDAVHGVEERHGLVELQHQLLGQLWGTRVSHACLGCRRWGCGTCRVSRGRLLGAGGVGPIGVTRVRRHRDGHNTLGTWSWHVWGVTYIYMACLEQRMPEHYTLRMSHAEL